MPNSVSWQSGAISEWCPDGGHLTHGTGGAHTTTLRSHRWLPAGTGALRGDEASPTPSAFHGHTLGTPPALGSSFASVC